MKEIISSISTIIVGILVTLYIIFPTEINNFISGSLPQFRFLLGLLFVIAIFLALREFFCWYWKINKRIEILENIEKHLEEKNKDK